jgi:hypothetical protein
MRSHVRSARHGWAGLAALLLALAGCDSTGPDQQPEASLTIVSRAAGAPPLESSVLSFYAVRGESREGELFYQDESGGRGERFLRLRFDDESIVTGADGLPVAPGDSVLITITVVDASRILFDFQPSGILFNPLERPELRIRYAEAEGDFDDDGDADAEDAAIEARLAIWRQEAPGLPFLRLGTVRFDDLDEVEAELSGFTRYAIAY